MRKHHLASVTLVATAAFWSHACSDDPAPCRADGLMAQNHARFPAGDTYWLPLPSDAACAGLRWEVTARPAGSSAAVVHDDKAGVARLTPLTAGTWTLSAKGHAASRTLTVAPASQRPFHHINYYPSRGLARVGAQIWAVSTFRAEVGRLNAVTLANEGTITVGPWPVALAVVKGGAEVVVAQRGNDTVGVIDVASGRLVDAIWVGDEPSNIVASSDGMTAWVALATENAVAEIDVAAREVTRRVAGPKDPLGLALSGDGKTLAVASHRSGHPDRFPWGTDPKEEERDIALVDTSSGEVTRWLVDVGTTINSLTFSADGKRLYAALLRNNIQANLGDPNDPSFTHAVVAFDVATGQETAAADLLRQKSSGGHAVSLHGLAATETELFVAAEASDAVVVLDASTLSEKRRTKVDGRPRAVLADKGNVWVLAPQLLQVSSVVSKEVTASTTLGEDPRPGPVAAGQRYFTGAGRQYAENWACNSCHTDGLTDTLTWNAGPFASRLVTRPFFWLEGTWPLGWQGYLSSIRNYAFTVNTNVGIRPVTDEAENLYAYLASLMPAPAANGLTARDGSHSKQALRGKKLYEGKGACAGCHGLPLAANRARIDTSITEGRADVPSLVGNYRQGVWLKHGEARTLKAGVEQVLAWSKKTLSDGEVNDLTRYVAELTGRDFFVLTSWPRAALGKLAPDGHIKLAFTLPVYNDPDNLGAIELRNAEGNKLPATVTASGRHVVVRPQNPLPTGQKVSVHLGAALRSWSDRPLFKAQSLTYEVAAKSTLKLSGDYRWTVMMPSPKPDFSGFNLAATAPTTVVMRTKTRASGADAVIDYAQGLVYQTTILVDGAELVLPPLPVPVGPSFADTFGSRAALKDTDGDGVADTASGTLTIAGPGFEEEGIKWSLSRPPAIDGCTAGPVDKADISVTIDTKGRPVIAWEGGKTNAIGVYVTDVGANLPFGPGQKVTGGKTYWAATATKFPAGFAGPITYGVLPDLSVDASTEHGAPKGGATLKSGQCYQFGVITNKFQVLLYYRPM